MYRAITEQTIREIARRVYREMQGQTQNMRQSSTTQHGGNSGTFSTANANEVTEDEDK